MAPEDFTSPEWRAFAAKILDERRKTPRTSKASESFVRRMTSSAADPDAALGEADDAAPAARNEEG